MTSEQKGPQPEPKRPKGKKPIPQDPAEAFVFDLCSSLFFPLWSYLNLLCHDGPELCDVLVACGDDIIIFSVKHVAFDPEGKQPQIAAERWRRRAIDGSIKQARGARRYLRKRGRYEVRSRFPHKPVVIDDIGAKRIHCVSVSLGSDGWIPFSWGFDAPEDFVHVFTEESFSKLLEELSTLPDFLGYLREKEAFLARTKSSMVIESELDLLALYVKENRKMPDFGGADVVHVTGGLWQRLIEKGEYQERLRRDRISGFWDLVLKDLITTELGEGFIAGNASGSYEIVFRIMALEDRFQRRMLSKNFLGLLGDDKLKARMSISMDGRGNLYVFMRIGRSYDPQDVAAELAAKCHVAIGLNRQRLPKLRAIGLATQPLDGNPLRSHTIVMVEYPSWTDEHERDMIMLRESGHFSSPRETHVHEDEYPVEGNGNP